MVLITEPLRHHLKKLLRILLIATDARAECVLERLDEVSRGDGFLVNRTLIEPVQHLFQSPSDGPLLQFLDPVKLLSLLTGGDLLLIRKEVVNLWPINLASMQFTIQVETQFQESRKRLQDGVDETVIGRIREADDGFFPVGITRVLSVNCEIGPEDVEERDRRQ